MATVAVTAAYNTEVTYSSANFTDEVIEALKRGGVGVLPSDTIYGLSCRALDEKAVNRVYELKGRNSAKPVIVLISNLKMLNLLSIASSQAGDIKKYWPGRLSVIFDAPDAPTWLTRGSRSLAVRWPADPELCKLISKVGPIVSTSANPEGLAPANNIVEAKQYFGDKIDFYLDGGKLDNSPSTVVKIEAGNLTVVRPGAVQL